jgi:hypothetical protein
MWKLLGAVAAVVVGAMVISMYPDLKRYINIESM